jgi:hypothetical protein
VHVRRLVGLLELEERGVEWREAVIHFLGSHAATPGERGKCGRTCRVDPYLQRSASASGIARRRDPHDHGRVIGPVLINRGFQRLDDVVITDNAEDGIHVQTDVTLTRTVVSGKGGYGIPVSFGTLPRWEAVEYRECGTKTAALVAAGSVQQERGPRSPRHAELLGQLAWDAIGAVLLARRDSLKSSGSRGLSPARSSAW